MARKDDVPVIPVAGGLQPRAAVAYMTVAALEVAWLCGAGPRMTTEVDVAAEHLEELVTEWGPDGSDASEAKVLARGLHGAIPVVSGSGLTEAVAYRWKTQVNENAKLPAFASELPELDHNEICGWSGAGEPRPLRGRVPRRRRHAPARARPDRADRGPHPRAGPRDVRRAVAGPDAGRAGACRSCCSATSCRSTSPCCGGSTRRRWTSSRR